VISIAAIVKKIITATLDFNVKGKSEVPEPKKPFCIKIQTHHKAPTTVKAKKRRRDDKPKKEKRSGKFCPSLTLLLSFEIN